MVFPSFSQWKQIFKVLKKGEKITLVASFTLAVVSFVFLTTNLYFKYTTVVPAVGGTYIEGIVGQPRFINPMYGETNDIDRTFIDLVFSGLMNYDSEGHIVNDLAESYQISNNAKTYDVKLMSNALWHDGKPVTADDVLFTIKTIQTSDYKSPLRANWIDVNVEKISDTQVRFTLKAPYNSFLENLTVKILPKHIWENITPENFTLSYYNLQPIGSGPYSFISLNQANTGFIKTLQLASNRKYYRKPAYLTNLVFQFFEKKEDLAKAINTKQVDGFTLAPWENSQVAAEKEISRAFGKNSFNAYYFSLPRYFAVFFNNQKPSLFVDKNIRKALSYAVNKTELVETINKSTKNNATLVDSPILPDFFDYQSPEVPYQFNVKEAGTLLDTTGFKDNGSGVRQKAAVKKPAFQFSVYLKIGSKGSEVTQLQQCLAKLDEAFKNILASETAGTYGTATETAVTEFQKKYLPGSKPTGETGAGTRTQLNKLCAAPVDNSQLLTFNLVTINQPQLIEVAEALKKYWQAVGVSVNINAVAITELKQIIKTRNYDALLYGEALGMAPDLYPFWHSSQKVDPGLNLSSYENKSVDQLLKEARETPDLAVKQQKYEKLQDTMLADAPALFLYNPNYIYWANAQVQGVDTRKIVDPAKRFSNITHWYVKTKRTWNFN